MVVVMNILKYTFMAEWKGLVGIGDYTQLSNIDLGEIVKCHMYLVQSLLYGCVCVM